MKRRNLLVVAVALSTMVGIGCVKSTINNPVYPDNSKFSFEVKGFHDTTIERSGELNYIIEINKLSGTSENVVLSVLDTPKGMQILLEKTINEPSFTTIAKLKTTRTAVGTYPIRVTAASKTAGIKETKLTIRVLPYSNEATGFIGDFLETGNCAKSSGHTTRMELVSGTPHRVNIKGFWHGTFTNEIYVDLNPSNKTLIVPSQTQNGLTFQGAGTYEDDKMMITYTVVGQNVNDNCTSTFTRN